MGLGLSTYSPQGGEGGSRWILGEKFDSVSPHKGSTKLLWETKWRAAVYLTQSGKGNANKFSARNQSTHSTMANLRTSSRFSRPSLPYALMQQEITINY